MLDLAPLNTALKGRGITGRVVEQDSRLYWRATATAADGVRKSRRIRLDLPANRDHLLEAESRVIQLATHHKRHGVLPTRNPWESEGTTEKGHTKGSLTVGDAVSLLETAYWAGKVRNSASVRSWQRIEVILRRLPTHATLTVELLVAVAATTEAGTALREQAWKVFKRLAKVSGLEELDKLDSIRTPYAPKERKLPTDEQLLQLLHKTINHPKYGWLTWALVTYGCRPAEACSLIPNDKGTAEVMSVKKVGMVPKWRTALALPVGDITPPPRSVPWELESPSQYDSIKSHRITQSWGYWLKHQQPGLRLYDIRHAWAVRSIRRMINASLAAKCMGHSLTIHHTTYHRWLDESDIAAVAAKLASG